MKRDTIVLIILGLAFIGCLAFLSTQLAPAGSSGPTWIAQPGKFHGVTQNCSAFIQNSALPHAKAITCRMVEGS